MEGPSSLLFERETGVLPCARHGGVYPRPDPSLPNAALQFIPVADCSHTDCASS